MTFATITAPPAVDTPSSAAVSAERSDRQERLEVTLRHGGMARHTVPAAGASVMGTGIVGIAAHTLPVHIFGFGVLADLSWVAAVLLLLGVVVLNVVQVARHPHVARAHLLDRRTAPATGTLAMAFLTVGTATLLVGAHWIGSGGARTADVVLYSIGTPLGLATALGVPLLLITRNDHAGLTDVTATWLLPVVPPMVSAAAGGILAQHLTPGTTRTTLIVFSMFLFGLSLLAALLMIAVLWARLLLHGAEPTSATPSLWVVLGPLGQGATALSAIAVASTRSLPSPYPPGLAVVALVGGPSLLGFAALWAALSAILTFRAFRQHIPFHLGWWSFTFPIGTCVTGLSALATRLDLPALKAAAVIGFAALLLAWLIVAVATIRGLQQGRLGSPLAPPRPVADPPGGRRPPLVAGQKKLPMPMP
jgi:tellurite resistance protein TehA-like permease